MAFPSPLKGHIPFFFNQFNNNKAGWPNGKALDYAYRQNPQKSKDTKDTPKSKDSQSLDLRIATTTPES